jgi:orotidine-5'-phosphate decarboxylase
MLRVDDEPIYERIARLATHLWNQNGQMALVVGATFPAELARVREIVGDMPLLVPGIGAQGGDIRVTVGAGQDRRGNGLIISSSRAILYADRGEHFARAAREAAEATRNEINRFRLRPHA